MGITDELMEGNEVIAADLEKAGWTKLPVDADDVPIRVGDVLVDVDTDERFEVRKIELDEAGWSIVNRLGSRYFPCFVQHVKHDDVEALLVEFFGRFAIPKPNEEHAAILAEYAGRIREAVGR